MKSSISSRNFSAAGLFITALLLLSLTPVMAIANTMSTNEPTIENRMGRLSIGGKIEINFTRVPNDLRATAVIGSPYILNDILSVKGFISQGFFKGVLDSSANTNTETWATYTAFGGGLSIGVAQKMDIVRPYVELGWMGVIPSSTFTATKFAWGLYGLLGFDILFNPGDFWGFFIETGTAGFISGGVAERIVGDYSYGSGVLINFGLRFYL